MAGHGFCWAEWYDFEKGYFLLQNVPAGPYVIKGFEADVGFQSRKIVTSRWDGRSQIFYPSNNIIDFTVRDWPEIQEGNIVNLEINYFMIDQANRVAHERFDYLQDKPGTFPDTKYTMVNPLNYYKTKRLNRNIFKKKFLNVFQNHILPFSRN